MNSYGGWRRYPATGFATAAQGENIVESIGSRNVAEFELHTKKEVAVTSNEYKINSSYHAAENQFLYTWGATVSTPKEERGAVKSIILEEETEYYIEYSAFSRDL